MTLTESPRWPFVRTDDWNEELMGPRVIEGDLRVFHAFVKPGDQIVVMRSNYLAVGRFAGTTEDHFNLEEQCIDLSEAAQFPLVDLVEANPGDVASLLTMVGWEPGDITIEIGHKDFIVFRYSASGN